MKKYFKGFALVVTVILTLLMMYYAALNVIDNNEKRATPRPTHTQQATPKKTVKKATPKQDLSNQRTFEVKEKDGSTSIGQYPYQGEE